MAFSHEVAGGFLLSQMRPFRIHLSGRAPSFLVPRMSPSSVCDGGQYFPKDQDAFAQVVLAGLPDGHIQDRGSIAEMQRKLEIKDYKTIWAITPSSGPLLLYRTHGKSPPSAFGAHRISASFFAWG